MNGFVGKEFDATRHNIFARGAVWLGHNILRCSLLFIPSKFTEHNFQDIPLGNTIDHKQGLAKSEEIYSSNHNLLRTIGFITILMAVPCLDHSMILNCPSYKEIVASSVDTSAPRPFTFVI